MKKVIVSLLCYIGFATQAWSLDLKALIAHSRGIVNESSYYTPTPTLSDQKIISLLNEAQDFASAYSWAFVKRTTFTLLLGVTEYYVPSDFQTAQRVTVNDIAIMEATLDALDSEGGAWLRSQGSPSNYYIRTTTMTTIGFYPYPNSSASTGSVTLDYKVRVAPLVRLGDIPFNGTVELYPFHQSLSKFVAYRFYLSNGNIQLADIYAKEFASDVKRMKEVVESKPNYRPGAVGYQRQ